MPYPNEHAARIENPSKYPNFRRKNNEFGDGIHAIYGIRYGHADLQAVRFSKDKWTEKEAKMWLNLHNMRPILFEPAVGENPMKRKNPQTSNRGEKLRIEEKRTGDIYTVMGISKGYGGLIQLKGPDGIILIDIESINKDFRPLRNGKNNPVKKKKKSDIIVYKEEGRYFVVYPAKKYIGAFKDINKVRSFLKPAVEAGYPIDLSLSGISEDDFYAPNPVKRIRSTKKEWYRITDLNTGKIYYEKGTVEQAHDLSYSGRPLDVRGPFRTKFEAQESTGSYERYSKKKSYKKNPARGSVRIYDTILEIKARKGKDSLWPGDNFVHKFKGKSKGAIYGNPDGSLTIKSQNGRKLWKQFNYPEKDR